MSFNHLSDDETRVVGDVSLRTRGLAELHELLVDLLLPAVLHGDGDQLVPAAVEVVQQRDRDGAVRRVERAAGDREVRRLDFPAVDRHLCGPLHGTVGAEGEGAVLHGEGDSDTERAILAGNDATEDGARVVQQSGPVTDVEGHVTKSPLA